jgi:hypothetical protein
VNLLIVAVIVSLGWVLNYDRLIFFMPSILISPIFQVDFEI